MARFIPRVILYIFSHFCSLMVVGGFGVGVLNWVLWGGVLERLGFGARVLGFLGLRLITKTEKNNSGKELCTVDLIQPLMQEGTTSDLLERLNEICMNKLSHRVMKYGVLHCILGR